MTKQVFALAFSAALPAILFVFCPTPASAQTSVTLYGVIDEGINYTNNVGRGHVYELASGDAQGSRWGLKGAEELGGGLKAIFQLENGFDVSSGRFNQGGRMFGRQAFVGLSADSYGTLTFGRQYDSVVDYLAQTTANGNWAGLLFSHPYDNDNTDNTFRMDGQVTACEDFLEACRGSRRRSQSVIRNAVGSSCPITRVQGDLHDQASVRAGFLRRFACHSVCLLPDAGFGADERDAVRRHRRGHQLHQ